MDRQVQIGDFVHVLDQAVPRERKYMITKTDFTGKGSISVSPTEGPDKDIVYNLSPNLQREWQLDGMMTPHKVVFSAGPAIKWLRKKGEKAIALSIDHIKDLENGLRHGDIIYDPDGKLGEKTLVVTTKDNVFNLMNTYDSGGAGYTQIPKEVSKYIEDPVDFYSEVLNKDGVHDFYQGVAIISFEDGRSWTVWTG